eukprot:TRINITY_DN637_c0_g3_i4.p1 TRINITY_DN637_c0_g3~~TRINITY_DN637_c0_g3_i4.p1  ORF type:complete len:1210 (-),score=506.44 TRINITY_DN637_c0_g3_i4:151-3717(-)
MAGGHLSKDFFELVKGIGEAKSKQEEDNIILNEVQVLKRKMSEKNVEARKMREYLIRMIYVEMLGHDFSFGHIHAVNLTHERTLAEKRVGYLGVSLCLHSEHELMLLLINTLQHDLRSDNHLEVAAALIVVAKLVNRETLPALLPLVVRALDHSQPNVRKKAICALHRFYQIDNTCMNNLQDKMKRMLCDKDPAVMGASLHILHDLAVGNATAFKDLVPSLVSILKQITEHRLPRDFDYHRMPAPWIQIRLLQLLAVLGAADRTTSEGMYEVLHEVVKRADIGINVGYAIIYECVRTITAIYPSNTLFEEAAASVSRFLTSENHNLKYLGINALAAIVQINPRYATDHQLVVIDCLEDPDETLKRKTLDLLFRITNPANVVIIVEKLMSFLRQTQDVYLRTELVSRITQLAERYAPNNAWYIHTMNTVFELGGSIVRAEVAHNMMRLIAEGGSGGSEDGSGGELDIRVYAVEAYLKLLEKPLLSDILLQVIAWVLGEFAHLSITHSPENIVQKLCDLMERSHEDGFTRSWILSAIMKVVAHLDSIPPEVSELVARYQSSVSVDVQQRCHEFLELTKTPALMRAVLPLDSSIEPLQVDIDLSFLDDYVNEALSNGAQPYSPPNILTISEDQAGASETAAHAPASTLIYTPYQAPTRAAAPSIPEEVKTPASLPSAISAHLDTTAPTTIKFSGVKKVWGPDGYNDQEVKKTPEPSRSTEDNVPPSVTSISSSSISSSSLPASIPTSSPPTVAPVSSAAAREREREISEKERQAHRLFAGLPGVATAPAIPTAPTPAIPAGYQRSAAAAAAPAAAAARPGVAPVAARPVAAPVAAPAVRRDEVDLLDLALGSSPSPAPRPAAPAAPAASSVDLLAGFSSPAPAPAPAPVASVADPLDLLMSPAPAAPAAAPAASLDLLGSLGLGVAAAPVIQQGLAGASELIRNKWGQLSQKEEKETLLASQEGELVVTCLKAWQDSSLLVAVFITNLQPQTSIQGALLQLAWPAGLQAGLESHPAARAQNNVLVLPTLEGGATFTQLINLTGQNIAAGKALANGAVNGAVAYMDGRQNRKQLAFRVPLPLSDLLRPVPLNTQQFGVGWKQHSQEVRFALAQTSVNSSAEFMNRIRQLRLHPVETIGAENIAAGKLALSAAQPALCFIHGKVKPSGLDIIVRSSDKDFSTVLAALAQVLFR